MFCFDSQSAGLGLTYFSICLQMHIPFINNLKKLYSLRHPSKLALKLVCTYVVDTVEDIDCQSVSFCISSHRYMGVSYTPNCNQTSDYP